MRECTKKTVLGATTAVSAVTSFVCLCISVSTDHWLYALERLVSDTSATTNVTFKRTATGLWRKCTQIGSRDEVESAEKTCSYNDYFNHVDKDGLGPTDSIILSLRRSTLFPMLSLVILLVGEVIAVMSHYNRRRKVLTFVSGILFVIAGLFTLIGIILYIGAITEEAGNKGKSSMDGPSFQYWYGASFILNVLSFTTAELTGVLAVYLYISRHKHAYRNKIKRLAGSAASSANVALAGGPLIHDDVEIAACAAAAGSANHRSTPHHFQQQQHPMNHYVTGGARPNGRIVSGAGPAYNMDGRMLTSHPSYDVMTPPSYMTPRHMTSASSVGRDLMAYGSSVGGGGADSASYNGSVLMRGSPLGGAVYRRSMDSLLVPSEQLSVGDIGRRTTPV